MKRAKDGSPRNKRPRIGQRGRLVLVTCTLLAVCVLVDAVMQTDDLPLVSADVQVEQNGTPGGEAQNKPPEQNGEAENEALAGQDVKDDAAFFAAQRLEKEKVRAQEIELLQELAAAGTTTAEARAKAENDVMRIAENMEIELVLEGLLTGKYGGEAAVFIQTGRVDVILAPTLKEIDVQETERIAELVNNYTGVGFENTVVTVR